MTDCEISEIIYKTSKCTSWLNQAKCEKLSMPTPCITWHFFAKACFEVIKEPAEETMTTAVTEAPITSVSSLTVAESNFTAESILFQIASLKAIKEGCEYLFEDFVVNNCNSDISAKFSSAEKICLKKCPHDTIYCGTKGPCCRCTCRNCPF